MRIYKATLGIIPAYYNYRTVLGNYKSNHFTYRAIKTTLKCCADKADNFYVNTKNGDY